VVVERTSVDRAIRTKEKKKSWRGEMGRSIGGDCRKGKRREIPKGSRCHSGRQIKTHGCVLGKENELTIRRAEKATGGG